MVDINWTVFPQIINFLILIIALNIVLYKPIRKILTERKTKVEGLSKGIETNSIAMPSSAILTTLALALK